MEALIDIETDIAFEAQPEDQPLDATVDEFDFPLVPHQPSTEADGFADFGFGDFSSGNDEEDIDSLDSDAENEPDSDALRNNDGGGGGGVLGFLSSALNFAGDLFGFDGSFGIDGASSGSLSFGNFGSAVGDLAASAWAFPNTVIGAAIGFVGFAIDHAFGNGDATIALRDGILHFEDSPLVPDRAALTLGEAQIFGLREDQISRNGFTIGEHEDQHTIQAEILGPFFLPAYGVAGFVSVLDGGGFVNENNFFEEGPYDSPPEPW